MAATLGVLVAGGAGSRLGLGVPKALARVGGMRLLDRGLAILASECDVIVTVAPAGLALPVPEWCAAAGERRPVHRVDDPPGASGPLAGMIAGLGSRPLDRAIVLGVDLPFVEPAILRAFLARLAGHEAVVPVPGGTPQPLAAAYSGGAVRRLAARFAAGERSATRALASLEVAWMRDAELAELGGRPDSFFNLNTAADRDEAERRLAARAAGR